MSPIKNNTAKTHVARAVHGGSLTPIFGYQGRAMHSSHILSITSRHMTCADKHQCCATCGQRLWRKGARLQSHVRVQAWHAKAMFSLWEDPEETCANRGTTYLSVRIPSRRQSGYTVRPQLRTKRDSVQSAQEMKARETGRQDPKTPAFRGGNLHRNKILREIARGNFHIRSGHL